MILVSSISFSQSDCSEVLLLAGRNVSSQTRTASILKSVYDKYCSSENINNSNEFNADINILKKVGISLGSGSQKQKKEQMCKIYESKYQSFEYETGFESRVVVDAIQAWKECQGLTDVEFNLTKANDIYTIGAKALTTKDVKIEGLNFNPLELKVRAKVEGVYQEIDPGFEYELKGDNHFSINIERIKQTDEGNNYYPKSGIIVITNVGDYPVIFPKEGLPKYQWLSEIDSQMKLLQSELKYLKENSLLRDDIIFGISNYSARDQDKTFTTTNLLTQSNDKGKNKTFWYNLDGKAVVDFDKNTIYNVWANIMVKGKKDFANQNFILQNKYIGEFEAGKEHELLKLGSRFSNGESLGGISIMFFAIKK